MAGLPGVVITIAAESAQAVRGIRDTNKALKGMGSTSAGVASGIRSAMVPATAALGALAAGGLVAANAASDLEQATGAMRSVFGPASAAIERAAESANRLGLSTADYNQNAAVMGALLKSTGSDAETAAASAESLIGAAADMAAQFGGGTSQAVEAINAALRGSYEVLDNYGVKMSAAEVAAYAASEGMTTAEAAVALLQQKLGDTGTTGAAAREMDTFASRTDQAKAAMEDATAAIGSVLLPVLADLAGHLSTAAAWAQENSTLVQVLAGVIGALAAVIVVLNVAMSVYTVVQWAANTALWSFPVVWIVAAVIAVIAAAVLLWKNWDKVTAALKRAWDAVVGAFKSGAAAISGFFSGLWDDVKGFVNRAIDAVNKLIAAFNRLPGPDLPTVPNLGASAAGRSAGTATAAPATTVVVNFNGLVADPEGTARAVRRTLERSRARNGFTRAAQSW